MDYYVLEDVFAAVRERAIDTEGEPVPADHLVHYGDAEVRRTNSMEELGDLLLADHPVGGTRRREVPVLDPFGIVRVGRHPTFEILVLERSLECREVEVDPPLAQSMLASMTRRIASKSRPGTICSVMWYFLLYVSLVRRSGPGAGPISMAPPPCLSLVFRTQPFTRWQGRTHPPNEVSLLPGCRAAVHDEGLACDVGGGWRGEEDHDSFEVLGVAEALEGDALEHSLFELLDQAAAHTGREPARGYGVDGNAMRGPGGSQVTGHGDDGALGRVVAYGLHVVGVAAHQACHAGDVDDGTAGSAFDHAPPGRLGHEKRPPHVHPEYLVEALQRHLRRRRPPRSPAIIDDYIETPESLLGLRHDSLHVLGVGDVALDGQRPATSGLYLCLHFLERFYLSRAQHDAGSGV